MLSSTPRWIFPEVVGLRKDQLWKMEQLLNNLPVLLWRVTEYLEAGLRAEINLRFGEHFLVLSMASLLEMPIARKSSELTLPHGSTMNKGAGKRKGANNSQAFVTNWCHLRVSTISLEVVPQPC